MKNYSILALLPLFVACASNPGFGDDSTDDAGSPGDDGAAGSDGTTPGNDAGNPPPTNAPLATGITVSGVTMNQGVEVNVVKNGAAATHNAPIVAGRAGLVRVFVTPSSAFSHALTGELTLTTGGAPKIFTASLTPASASTDASQSSTFNFIIDAASLGTDTTYLVQIKDPQGSGSGDTTAQYPNSGTATSLGVKSSGNVKINVYPIAFTSGGGTAATGSVDVGAYQKIVMGLYPAANVTLTVESPLSYTGAVPDAFDQSGAWEKLLSFLQKKRAADATPDVYYYGAFAPSSSFANFCGSGCIAGLSGIPNGPTNYSQKASIGLAYGGDSFDQQSTGQTMAHEVGHGHGREHSPTSQSVQGCSQPSGIDPSYPYSNGAIGVWGWDVINQKAKDPSQFFDVMGYCENDWISDYTYSALEAWIATDNGFDMMPGPAVTYRQIYVKADGTLEVGDAYPVYGPMSGEQHTVTFDDGHTATGFYFPYDHIAGGYVLVPEPTHFTSLKVQGFAKLANVAH
ncbi:MAG TPA: hypothetical protein VH054_06550 [Polyangiaceae bacterium]|nr:hypothetical protein [Polyangiaceae bacterium]